MIAWRGRQFLRCGSCRCPYSFGPLWTPYSHLVILPYQVSSPPARFHRNTVWSTPECLLAWISEHGVCSFSRLNFCKQHDWLIKPFICHLQLPATVRWSWWSCCLGRTEYPSLVRRCINFLLKSRELRQDLSHIALHMLVLTARPSPSKWNCINWMKHTIYSYVLELLTCHCNKPRQTRWHFYAFMHRLLNLTQLLFTPQLQPTPCQLNIPTTTTTDKKQNFLCRWGVTVDAMQWRRRPRPASHI